MDASIIAALIGVSVIFVVQIAAVAYWGGGISRGLKDLNKSFNKLPCQRDGNNCPGEDCMKK